MARRPLAPLGPCGTLATMDRSDLLKEEAAERRVGRDAFIWYAGITMGIWILSATSLLIRRNIDGVDLPWAQPWVVEGTSLILGIPLYFLVRWFEIKAPIGEASWRQALPVHLIGSTLYCGLLIAWMAIFRAAVWPPLFGHGYDLLGDTPLQVILYEYRKLLPGYLGALGLIYTFRQMAMMRLELDAARVEARSTQRLTLKCGGRVMRVEADGFVSAKAAGNYVELRTGTGEHLARMTLAELEKQLIEAGVDAVRVHRSWLVNRDVVEEITPTGEGDVSIRLKNGDTLPGSRRYRDKLVA